jgi:hypothetical protein
LAKLKRALEGKKPMKKYQTPRIQELYQEDLPVCDLSPCKVEKLQRRPDLKEVPS